MVFIKTTNFIDVELNFLSLRARLEIADYSYVFGGGKQSHIIVLQTHYFRNNACIPGVVDPGTGDEIGVLSETIS